MPVLVYHGVAHSGSAYSVTPEQLAEQCAWLVANGYSAVTLGQFWDASQGYAKLPPNPVVLTNDDGAPSAIAFADILAAHGMVATYFVNNTSPLTAEQVQYLAARGEVAAHTVSHVALGGLDSASQLAEIANNEAYLEGITGQPVRFLAWPFGDVNASAVEAAKAAGIVGAVGLGGTAAHLPIAHPYYIPRITMGPEIDFARFGEAIAWW